MPPVKHAVLSASSASRWINCPPSVRLSESYADTTTDYAQEGTDAHALCEYYLLKSLGRDAEDPRESLSFFNAEMDGCARDYASYIMETVEEAKKTCADPVVLVEQRVDFSAYAPEGFGTADALVIADGTLHVCDFKYGTGVPVSAEENPQLKLYALGALSMLGSLYDVTDIELIIYQPRLSNISTFSLPVSALYEWAEKKLKPAAGLAYNGEGEYSCGPWCRFCKAKTECRERAKYNLSAAKYDFAEPPLLTDEEIEDILPRLDDLTAWAEDIKKYAFDEALKGRKWHGFKLVAGRSVRKYSDENAVAGAVTAAGFDPYEKKLLGITEMTKMLGKTQFSELLGPFVIKPDGKPVLVPESDKRKEISINSDFQEEN